jgi:hypothetical protein
VSGPDVRRAGWRLWARLGSPVAGGLVALMVSWSAFGPDRAPVAAPTSTGPAADVPTATGPPPSTTARPTTAPAVSSTAVATTTGRQPPAAGTSLGGCPNLPAQDVWHADVSALPVHGRSAQYVASIGADRAVKADFGSGLWEGGPIGIPITYVDGGRPRVPVSFAYAAESDPGPYPVPRDALVEGGPDGDGDRHVLVVDTGACRLYELFDAHPGADGSWRAGSGATYDLRSHALRPAGWTSADAAGLPIAPGLVRYEEVAAGRVDHAVRVTVPRSQRAYVWPARHVASSASDPALPPMGLRLRLRAGVDISGLPTQARVVAQAMKTHGVIVADNGSAWYLGGAPDPRWDNDALRALGSLRGDDFEAVDTSALMVDPDSGKVR